MSTSELGVAIMAGGAGLRLRTLNGPRPKALSPFCGHSLLEHQLARTAVLAPTTTVVLAHHGAAQIQEVVQNRAQVLIEEHPLGTAGGLFHLPDSPSHWLVINVDHISDVDLVRLRNGHHGPCTAVVTQVEITIDEGVVELAGDRLIHWRERPRLPVTATTGLYLFERSAISRGLSGGRTDMPELVSTLIPDGVRCEHHHGIWFDAGTPERLQTAAEWWQQHTRH